jgi:hypothetical protein
MHGPHSNDGNNLAVALAMAKAGLPIFPAAISLDAKKQKWQKAPLIKNWQTEATTDPNRLKSWWREWPDAAPGIELGRARLVVIDGDRHGDGQDGVANFAALVKEHGELPPHPENTTAGDGEHHYFAQPDGKPFTNAEGDLRGRGINVRGAGGWVVAPGSTRPDGKRWDEAGLTDAYFNKEIPPLPAWLCNMIQPPRSKPVAPERHPPRQPSDADEVARAEAALRCIPSDDRTTWFEMGAALHSTGWPCARAIWDDWSLKTPGAFDAEDQETTWRSFDRGYGGKRITLASLFYLAQAHGYRDHKPSPHREWMPPDARLEQESDDARNQDEAARAPGEDPARAKTPPLNLEEWLARELPPPDCILGHWLTTTSRVLVSAPSGLGKTMLGLALALATAAGKGFLHWGGVRPERRPARVLFIDGEMSRRLLKQRLADEVARLGMQPDGMFVLSHEDVENFAPLNSPEGQAFINKVIRAIGGVDLIVFDNIMSLIAGDMKDEESWRQTLPWVRTLTRNNIGQFWIHHTGHDESRGYGTKTREWQMDTVLHLEEIERPDTSVSFQINFRKARERTPDNRADFADTRIALVNNAWIAQPVNQDHKRNSKLSPLQQKFLDALRNAAIGNEANKMFGCPAARLDTWRDECIKRGLLDTDKPDSARTLFSKYKRELIAANRIGANETMAWLL